MKTDRRENVKFIVTTNFKDRFASYITTSYRNMFSLGLTVISRVFVAVSACVCLLEKIQHKSYCCSNPKIPCPANKSLLKVRGRNPKARGKIC